jgi:hypothetical protein
MAIAQAIHETSERDPATDKWRPLSSWWAQRPRRNPAGLGVTGQMRATQPVDVKAWQQDTRPQPPVWRAGLAFDSWDISSRAHIGRLLAYSVPAGAETPAQIELINFALAFRPLPTNLRGTAPTAKMLGARFNPTGRGWATPGTNYGEKIAQVAQEITQA